MVADYWPDYGFASGTNFTRPSRYILIQVHFLYLTLLMKRFSKVVLKIKNSFFHINFQHCNLLLTNYSIDLCFGRTFACSVRIRLSSFV
jgi:hypothetical protein